MTKKVGQHNKEYRQFQFRIEEVEKDSGRISGYATVFDVINPYYQEIFVHGAFSKTINESKGGKVPIISEHWGPWIGMNTSAVENDYGLYVDGLLAIERNVAAQGSHELALLAQEVGRPAGISIGFSPIKREIDDETGITRQIEVAWWEWSLCPPGFQSLAPAEVSDVRSVTAGTIKGFLSNNEGRLFLADCLRDIGIKIPAPEPEASTQAATDFNESQLRSMSEALTRTVNKLTQHTGRT